MSDFILDIQKIRQESRAQIESGAVTPAYKADRMAVLKILDAALATEWLCVLRYTQHALSAQGIHADSVAQHFSEHAGQEQEHAHSLSERIKQLGGKIALDPNTFKARGHSEYKEADSLADMIKENLIAERIAIESYTQAINFIGKSDPTTRRILESILQVEEEHAEEMADLLVAFDPRTKLH